MLVGPDIRRVDRERPLQGADRVILDDHVLKDLLPGAILGPDPQSFVQRLPRPVLLRHVPPRRPGPQPPQDPVDHLPVIPPPATPTTIRRRQQRLDPRPRHIRQLTTPNTHEPDITNPVTRAFTGQALAGMALNRQAGTSANPPLSTVNCPVTSQSRPRAGSARGPAQPGASALVKRALRLWG